MIHHIGAQFEQAFDIAQPVAKNDSSASKMVAIAAPLTFLHDSEVERSIVLDGMRLFAQLRPDAAPDLGTLRDNALAYAERYPSSIFARQLAGTVLQFMSDWDDLFNLTVSAKDPYLLAQSTLAAMHIGRWDHVQRVNTDLAGRSENEWNRLVYLGLANLGRLQRDQTPTCFPGMTTHSVDQIANVLRQRNSTLSPTPEDSRRLVGALAAILAKNPDTIQREDAIKRAPQSWRDAKRSPAAFSLDRFARESPELVALAFQLSEISNQLLAENCANGTCSNESYIDVALAETGMSRTQLAANGCATRAP